MIASARVPFIMGRDKIFFYALEKVHPKFDTTHIALLVQEIWASVLCYSGTFEKITNVGKRMFTYIYKADFSVDVKNEESIIPDRFHLYQNYPNPFNSQTTILHDVKEKGFVQLKVYDMLGNEVAVLVNEFKEQGRFNIDFSASELPSGVYIYSIKINDFIQHRKMTLLK